jgi:hypothetical protein
MIGLTPPPDHGKELSVRARKASWIIFAALLTACIDDGPTSLKSPPASARRAIDPHGSPIQIYGSWHCGNDYCTWGAVRDMTDFDKMNHWLIDRGNGQPSVNLVVLSFVQPYSLLKKTTDAQTLNGIPRGMTQSVVDYFKSRGVRVMLSIGGITYVSAWNQALAENATQLGLNAAQVAQSLGVGIEIDYEEAQTPDTTHLQTFINAYRSVNPYDATGANPAARLTIDLAAGDRWLIGLTTKATSDWLQTAVPVLDYANAMVPSKQPTASAATANWQEHIDGKPQYGTPILPLAPSKLTGAVYIADGSKALPECNNYSKSLQSATRSFVQGVTANGAGVTPGMLGFMFWAAERPSSRGIGTVPPNTCEKGAGAGATAMSIPIPMTALRTQ